MQVLLNLLLAASPSLAPLAVVEPIEPSKSDFVWGLEHVSNACKTRFESAVDKLGGFAMTFHDSKLSVDAETDVDYLSCKISWYPSIPSNKRLRSAELTVSGSYESGDRSDGSLRLGHRILGTGSNPSLKSYDLKDGKFSYKLQLQNIADDNCGKEVKLISTVSLFLNRDVVWKADPDSQPPELILNKVHLSQVEWEECPE